MVKPVDREEEVASRDAAQPEPSTPRTRTGSDSEPSKGFSGQATTPTDSDSSEVLPGSLFDAPNEDTDNPYGKPGRPISRRSAMYRGFWTTIGVAVAVLFAYSVREAATVLELVLVSAFLAVGLNPIVEFLIRRGWKRGWAVLLVATVLIALVTLIVTVLVGVLRDQITSFIDDAPNLLHRLLRHKTIAHLDNRYHIISDLQQKLADPNLAEKAFGGVYNAGLNLLTGLADTVIVFVLTLYFLAALPQLKRALFSLAPSSRRERVGQLGDEILRRVGRYVIGAVVVATIAGTVTILFLLTVGLSEYALPLAIAVGLLDLVPLVGSITGAAIVCLVSLANSLPVGIAALIFYLIYETVEGYVIYPRVMRSSVDVPEYLTIVAVLLGGAISGVVGALLALPIAAAGLLLVREVWVRRQDRA
ncbi:MAG: AI-2E family transporter [Actinomycetota bacterium]|nr:AI-2E family transporter [Actinomycetota bacterium]